MAGVGEGACECAGKGSGRGVESTFPSPSLTFVCKSIEIRYNYKLFGQTK